MNFTTSTISALIGTPGSPASLAISASVSATLAVRTNNTASNVLGGGIFGAVIIGSSAPTSNPTVQFSYTVDGTNYLADGGAFAVPITPVSTTYAYRYSLADAPPEAVGIEVTVTNGTGYAITHWWQGVTESLT
jgi:hypothetical protein